MIVMMVIRHDHHRPAPCAARRPPGSRRAARRRGPPPFAGKGVPRLNELRPTGDARRGRRTTKDNEGRRLMVMMMVMTMMARTTHTCPATPYWGAPRFFTLGP